MAARRSGVLVFELRRRAKAEEADLRPNGLRVSRRLEGIRLIRREGLFLLPAAKIAPIQPVGYTRLFGGLA